MWGGRLIVASAGDSRDEEARTDERGFDFEARAPASAASVTPARASAALSPPARA